MLLNCCSCWAPFEPLLQEDSHQHSGVLAGVNQGVINCRETAAGCRESAATTSARGQKDFGVLGTVQPSLAEKLLQAAALRHPVRAQGHFAQMLDVQLISSTSSPAAHSGSHRTPRATAHLQSSPQARTHACSQACTHINCRRERTRPRADARTRRTRPERPYPCIHAHSATDAETRLSAGPQGAPCSAGPGKPGIAEDGGERGWKGSTGYG